MQSLKRERLLLGSNEGNFLSKRIRDCFDLRGSKVILSHGETTVQPRDILVIVVGKGA